jgi:leucyl-tRNA synthetase
LLLAPYVPHLAEELWVLAGHQPSIANQKWPEYQEELTIDDEIELVIQINGKVRSKIQVPLGLPKETLQDLAMKEERIIDLTTGKNIVKTIVVPDKLVNIVVKG